MEKRAHVIGICGLAMSAAARLLQEDGWIVTGSDEGFYPPASTYVEKLGIKTNTGFKAEHIPQGTSLVVIGKNAKLSPETNEEVKAAMERGIPMKSAAEIIGEISAAAERRLVVAGSFGKSTVTALIAWILSEAGKDPGHFVGAMVPGMEHTARRGSGSFFVLEGDEYPSGHDDPRAKFMHYRPHDVLLTSLTHDHVNVYPTMDAYMDPFRDLVQSLPANGLLVACLDNGDVSQILAQSRAPAVTYSLTNALADWCARDVELGEKSGFTLMRSREPIATVETSLLGMHNMQNILGAAAYLLERALATKDEIRRGVATFRGLSRRLDKKTMRSRVPAYEGFGSSDAKARSAIEAIRAHFPDKRLIVVFEPHTFSWRNRATIHWYDKTFRSADELLVYHPASQGSSTHDQLSHDEIIERLEKARVKAHKVSTPDETLAKLKENVRDGDAVLLLTSGAMDGLVEKIPSWLDEAFA